ncbi:MAG: glycosyltransferase family 2 protein [Myxococcota bacterium]
MRILATMVNYRVANSALRCLEPLVQDLSELQGRVLVVDNDLPGDDLRRLQEGSQVHGDAVEVISSGENGGFGYGCNIGLRRGLGLRPRPDYLMLINPDAEPEPGCSRALVEYMDAHPEVGIAAPRIRDDDGVGTRVSGFRFPNVLGEFAQHTRLDLFFNLFAEHLVAPVDASSQQPGPTDWVTGACMLIRPAMLEAIGLFDEGFFLYFEEVDLCLRAHQAGFERHVVGDAYIRHVGGIATGIKERGRRLPSYWFESRRRFFRKNRGPGYSAAVMAASLVGHSVFALQYSARGKRLDSPPKYARDLLLNGF